MAAETVAKLVIPRQNIFYFERKPFWEVYMRADPWHGLKSLQPLGSPNRLMRVGTFLVQTSRCGFEC